MISSTAVVAENVRLCVNLKFKRFLEMAVVLHVKASQESELLGADKAQMHY